MKFWDILALIFWFGIFATPLLSYFVFRKSDIPTVAKLGLGILFVLILSLIFYTVSIAIIFRNGLGPDSVY